MQAILSRTPSPRFRPNLNFGAFIKPAPPPNATLPKGLPLPPMKILDFCSVGISYTARNLIITKPTLLAPTPIRIPSTLPSKFQTNPLADEAPLICTCCASILQRPEDEIQIEHDCSWDFVYEDRELRQQSNKLKQSTCAGDTTILLDDTTMDLESESEGLSESSGDTAVLLDVMDEDEDCEWEDVGMKRSAQVRRDPSCYESDVSSVTLGR